MIDNAQGVIECIERAFADVRLEEGISLREAEVIDDYGTDEQRANAREEDEKDDWRKLSDDSVAHYYWCPAFFDAKGLRFHLPAYMCFALRHYNDSASPSIDQAIIFSKSAGGQFDLLTVSQKEAVLRFLEFMAIEAGNPTATQILDELWTNNSWI